jgi:hypothetical protein
MRARRRIEQHQIAACADAEGADVAAAQGARAAGGRRPDRLGDRHAHLAHGERDHERQSS